jgi:hypothetical protein
MLLETNFRVSNLKFSCLPALAATASYSMLTAGASRACFTPAPTYFVFAADVGTPTKPRLRAAISQSLRNAKSGALVHDRPFVAVHLLS